MNHVARKFLGWLTTALFVCSFVLIATPQLLWRRLKNLLKSAPDLVRRRTEMTWQFAWARRWWKMIKMVLGMEMPITIEGEIHHGTPHILVLNHRTVMDHLVAATVMKRVGLDDVRWVVKNQMERVPIVGGVFRRAGFAFVSRKGDPGDRLCIRYMAVQARDEGASVAIYPEGTRFSGKPKPDSRFSRINPPRLGGFKIICEEMPEARVLVVCLDWGEMGMGGRTMWDGESYVGRHCRCVVWEEENPGPDGAEAFLNRNWEKMEALCRARPDPSPSSEGQIVAT